MADKLKVLIDLDSIIVNIESAWYSEYNRRFDDDLTIERVLDWDTAKYAKAGKRVFDILREPGFFAGLAALPGAVAGVERLTFDPLIDVYILSYAPTVDSFSEKAHWVKDHLRSVAPDHLILTGSKSMVAGDVLFDDGPHNLTGYAATWPRARLATIAYPYNESARQTLGPRVYVAGDYHDTALAWQNFTSWMKELCHG